MISLIEKRTHSYVLLLRKPDKTPVAYIPFNSLSFTKSFNAESDLSFTVSKYLYSQKTHKNYISPIWDKMLTGWIVEIREYDSNKVEVSDLVLGTDSAGENSCIYREYMTIENPQISTNDGVEKSVECVSSYRVLFNKTKLRGYDDTRKLFDCELDEYNNIILDSSGCPIPIPYDTSDSTVGGILNYILEYLLPGWKVGYYDTELFDVGKSSPEKSYDEDLFTGEITYGTDVDGHQVLLTGLKKYWTRRDGVQGEGYELLSLFSHSPVTDYMDDTNRGNYEYRSRLNSLGRKIAPSDWLSDNSIAKIMKEPLKGAELLGTVQECFVELKSYLQDLYSYKYVNLGEDLFPDEIQEYIENVEELCNAMLNNFISPMANAYGDAVGSVPYRALKFAETNLTEVFDNLQKSFLCIFTFDSINKIINIYARNNPVVDKEQPLILNPKGHILSMSYESNTDNIVTRLYPKGKDDITVAEVGITGQRYVDDFSYFVNSESGMSEDLVLALDRRNTYIEQHKNDYIPVQLFTCNTVGTTTTYGVKTSNFAQSELLAHISKLSDNVAEAQSLARAFFLTRNEGGTNEDLQDEILENAETIITPAQTDAVELSSESIDTQFRQIVDFPLNTNDNENIYRVWNIFYDEPNTTMARTLEDLVDDNAFYLYCNLRFCEEALVNFQSQFTYENVIDNEGRIFNTQLLEELKEFVYEEDISFENISAPEVLYEYAKEYLTYINTVPITLSVDLIDMLSNYRYQLEWEQITDVGAKFHFDYEDFNLDVNGDTFKLISYTHSINSSGSTLTGSFSNSYEIENAYNKIMVNVWSESYKQIQSINSYRTSWEDFLSKQNDLLLQGEKISAETNSIVDSTGKVVVDGNGLSLSKGKNNALQNNADGYYVRKKSYASTKNGTNYVANTKIYPDNIVFADADVSYSENVDGTTTLSINGTGVSPEVIKSDIVAADMIEATAAFIDDLQIERLETNLKNYICLPNITVVNDVPVWNNNTHTWRAKSGYANVNVRGYIKIYEMMQEYIEAHLVVPADTSAIIDEELTAVQINGRQLYFTSVSGTDAFAYLTFTAPRVKYPTMSSEVAAMYTVYKRKSDSEYTKMKQNFVWDEDNNTYNVETVYGTGDVQGRGLYKFIKDDAGGRFIYISRTDGKEYGIKMKDDGIYKIFNDVEYKDMPYKVYSSYAEMIADANIMPTGSFGYVSI